MNDFSSCSSTNYLVFFVTLQEFSAFLYLKAVWGIEGKWGYDLATVLNSTFCYELHSKNTRRCATSHFMAHHRVQR